MSFILDALKKIEQEKRRTGPNAAESFAAASRKRSRKRQALSIGAVALGSAAVTALALSTFSGNRDGVEPEPVSESAAAMTLSEIVPPVVAEQPDPAPAPEPDLESASEPDLESASEPEPTVVTEETTSSAAVEETTSSAAAPAVEEPPPEEKPSETESSAFRLVGRERVEQDVSREIPPPPAEEPAPSDDLPDLVLQGTSVIGDKPVAVISDKRVFEGDRVKGALVVRIGEREVELELDGRRFILRF